MFHLHARRTLANVSSDLKHLTPNHTISFENVLMIHSLNRGFAVRNPNTFKICHNHIYRYRNHPFASTAICMPNKHIEHTLLSSDYSQSEYITSLADVSFHVVAHMYARFRYSGKNPLRFAVFWRISVRFCCFRTPLTPPSDNNKLQQS